jgi:glutaconate CoA-transferase subunit B
MRLISLHPGVTLEAVRAEVGWEAPLAATIAVTPAPTEAELRLIRVELDPGGMYR